MTYVAEVSPAEVLADPIPPTRSRADAVNWQPIVGMAIVLLGSLYVVWLLWRGFYYVDDFLRLSEARRATLNWSYLSQSVYGHFAPGWRLTYFALQRGDPLGYLPVIALTAVLQAGALLGFLRLLNALFGRVWRNLIFVTWFAVSPAMLTTQFWFANALHVLPSLAFTVWGLDGFVRYLLAHRARHLAYSVASVALGLMFYEKPVIIAILMPALILVIATQTGSLADGVQAGGRRIVSLWRAWILYAVPLLAYLWYYSSHSYYESVGRPSPGVIAHVTWLAWFRGIGPALIGGPFHWQVAGIGGLSISHPSVMTTYLALASLLVLVVGSVIINDRAWRGWAFAVGAFSVSFAVAAWGRVESLGITMALDYRYSADTLVLVLLGVAIAWTPICPRLIGALGGAEDAAGQNSGRPRHRRTSTRWDRIAPLFAVVMLVAYLGASSVSIWRYRAVWNQSVSRMYWSNFEASLQRLQQSGTPFSLYNVPVPDTVGLLSQYPDDLLSTSAAIKYEHLSYNDLLRPLYMPDPATGTIRPAKFVEYVGATAGTSSPFIVPANGTLRSGSVCLPPGISHLTVPMQRTLPLQVYYLMIRYRSVAQSAFTPFARSNPRSRSKPVSGGVQLPASNHAVVVTLVPTAMVGATVLVSSNAGICFQSITVGLPSVG